MEKGKRLNWDALLLGGVLISGVIVMGIGGFIYTPRPSQEFLEERHKIDSTYSARSDSLHKDYQTQLNNLEEKFD